MLETGVAGENHWPALSHWQTLSHLVAISIIALLLLLTSTHRICRVIEVYYSTQAKIHQGWLTLNLSSYYYLNNVPKATGPDVLLLHKQQAIWRYVYVIINNGSEKNTTIRNIWNLYSWCPSDERQLVSSISDDGTLSSGNNVIKIKTGHDETIDSSHMTPTATVVRNLDPLNDNGRQIARYLSIEIAVRVTTDTNTLTVWNKHKNAI